MIFSGLNGVWPYTWDEHLCGRVRAVMEQTAEVEKGLYGDRMYEKKVAPYYLKPLDSTVIDTKIGGTFIDDKFTFTIGDRAVYFSDCEGQRRKRMSYLPLSCVPYDQKPGGPFISSLCYEVQVQKNGRVWRYVSYELPDTYQRSMIMNRTWEKVEGKGMELRFDREFMNALGNLKEELHDLGEPIVPYISEEEFEKFNYAMRKPVDLKYLNVRHGLASNVNDWRATHGFAPRT